MEILDKIKYWALGLMILAAFKFYNKDSAEKKIHSQLVEMCATDSVCEEIVESKFEECFEANYKMGVGKAYRESSRTTFDQKSFMSCFTNESGDQIFRAAH